MKVVINYVFSVKKSESTGDRIIFFKDLYGAATVYNCLRRMVEESEMPFIALRGGIQNHIRLLGNKGKEQWNAYISRYVFDGGIEEGIHYYYFKLIDNILALREIEENDKNEEKNTGN